MNANVWINIPDLGST